MPTGIRYQDGPAYHDVVVAEDTADVIGDVNDALAAQQKFVYFTRESDGKRVSFNAQAIIRMEEA